MAASLLHLYLLFLLPAVRFSLDNPLAGLASLSASRRRIARARERYNQALNTRWRIASRRPDLAQPASQPAGRANGSCRLLYNARDRDSNNTQRAGTVRPESNPSVEALLASFLEIQRN